MSNFVEFGIFAETNAGKRRFFKDLRHKMKTSDNDKKDSRSSGGKPSSKAMGWNAGFSIISAAVLLVFAYTLGVRDMTLYQIAILAISLYTMGTMSVCLFLPLRKKELSDRRPFISILVPAKNEELVIENTVRSLFKIDYQKEDGTPNYEVLVIDDDSTDSTLEILNGLKKEFPTLVPVHREGGRKGKSAALNFAVPKANGEMIAVFDADTIVDSDFFEKAVRHFTSDRIAGVQGRVRIFNKKSNFLTRVQDYEFTVFAHMLQMSKSIFGGVMQLAGNGQVVRKDALLSVGGWNELSSTDDQDLTIKFLLKGFLVDYVPETAIWQEAITKIWPLMRQRIRWSEGMLKCIFDYLLPVLLHRNLTLVQKVDGLSGLMRIVATLVVWVGYVQLFIVTVFPWITYYSCDSIAKACNIGMLFVFVFVMLGGLVKYLSKFAFIDLMLLPVYWFYNTVWLVAAPIGYVNSIKNKDRIIWDKTDHSVKNIEMPKD